MIKTDENYKPTKDKETAVFLAVIFSIFSWLYTYKTDNWKFWLNFALVFVSAGWWLIGAWLWVIIDQSIKDQKYFEEYYNF